MSLIDIDNSDILNKLFVIPWDEFSFFGTPDDVPFIDHVMARLELVEYQSDFKQWLEENNMVGIKRRFYLEEVSPNNFMIHVEFASDSEANSMLFKLTWL